MARGGFWRGIAVGAAAVVLFGAGTAMADSGSGTISACVGSGGALRVPKAGASCGKKESSLSWNQQGVPGAQGNPGPQGPPGPIGGNTKPLTWSGTVLARDEIYSTPDFRIDADCVGSAATPSVGLFFGRDSSALPETEFWVTNATATGSTTAKLNLNGNVLGIATAHSSGDGIFTVVVHGSKTVTLTLGYSTRAGSGVCELTGRVDD